MSRGRISDQEAFVLHTYPYRETSLIVELFTKFHGKVGVVAKGARRQTSLMRNALQSFQPLYVSWGGRSELKTLYEVEWRFGMVPLKGTALMSGFYINELVMKLMLREDPHESLFDVYEELINELSSNDQDIEKLLRRFEKTLLAELGYGLTLTHEINSGVKVERDKVYSYVVGKGPVLINGREKVDIKIAGKTLLDMSIDDLNDPQTLSQSKLLMRSLLGFYLGNKSLHTRKMLLDLQAT